MTRQKRTVEVSKKSGSLPWPTAGTLTSRHERTGPSSVEATTRSVDKGLLLYIYGVSRRYTSVHVTRMPVRLTARWEREPSGRIQMDMVGVGNKWSGSNTHGGWKGCSGSRGRRCRRVAVIVCPKSVFSSHCATTRYSCLCQSFDALIFCPFFSPLDIVHNFATRPIFVRI